MISEAQTHHLYTDAQDARPAFQGDQLSKQLISRAVPPSPGRRSSAVPPAASRSSCRWLFAAASSGAAAAAGRRRAAAAACMGCRRGRQPGRVLRTVSCCCRPRSNGKNTCAQRARAQRGAGARRWDPTGREVPPRAFVSPCSQRDQSVLSIRGARCVCVCVFITGP